MSGCAGIVLVQQPDGIHVVQAPEHARLSAEMLRRVAGQVAPFDGAMTMTVTLTIKAVNGSVAYRVGAFTGDSYELTRIA